jgi:hypothetical protein
MGPLSWSVTLR